MGIRKFVTPGSSEKFGDFILNSEYLSNRMEDSVQHMIEIWEKQNESDQSSDSSILGPIFDLPCICTAFQYSKGHWVTIVFFLSQFIFDVSKDPITTDQNAQLLILVYDGLKDSTIKRDHLMKFPRSIGLQMVAAIFGIPVKNVIANSVVVLPLDFSEPLVYSSRSHSFPFNIWLCYQLNNGWASKFWDSIDVEFSSRKERSLLGKFTIQKGVPIILQVSGLTFNGNQFYQSLIKWFHELKKIQVEAEVNLHLQKGVANDDKEEILKIIFKDIMDKFFLNEDSSDVPADLDVPADISVTADLDVVPAVDGCYSLDQYSDCYDHCLKNEFTVPPMPPNGCVVTLVSTSSTTPSTSSSATSSNNKRPLYDERLLKANVLKKRGLDAAIEEARLKALIKSRHSC